jgi:hypothetical protein
MVGSLIGRFEAGATKVLDWVRVIDYIYPNY